MKFSVYDNVLVKRTLAVTTVLEDRCNGYYYCSDRGTYSESEIEITDLPSNDCVEEVGDTKSKSNVTLTQPELQFLTKFLANKIESLEDSVQFHKGKVAHTWNYCIPNTSEAYLEFPRLNYLKTELRKRKELLKKFSEIQGKLKRQVGK